MQKQECVDYIVNGIANLKCQKKDKVSKRALMYLTSTLLNVENNDIVSAKQDIDDLESFVISETDIVRANQSGPYRDSKVLICGSDVARRNLEWIQGLRNVVRNLT